MRFHTKRKHMIDYLFPIALFFVFAISALTVLLLAARIYQSTTENSSLNYTSRTSLSYISEKIHQNDMDGKVTIGSFDGCDALIMEQNIDEDIYYTYIYANNKELKELFIKDGVTANASAGRTILEIQNFSMKQLSNNLLEFTCTDKKNQTASTIIGIRSM
ncbi:MAG: DUF4860 domain-containing protein [Dorea sp.]|jgi:hypothetical protein|nr:DUF4860 domain-containing protein [Dorea sp.]